MTFYFLQYILCTETYLSTLYPTDILLWPGFHYCTKV